MEDDTIKTVGGIALCIALCIALIITLVFVITYKREATVTVDDRAWEYTVKVQYDVETCSTDCDIDEEGNVTCDTSCSTSTYTRCSAKNQNNVLPIVRPTPTCARWWGDYESESVWYTVKYHDDKGQVAYSAFSGDRWDALYPNRVVKLTINAFNHVIAIDGKD